MPQPFSPKFHKTPSIWLLLTSATFQYGCAATAAEPAASPPPAAASAAVPAITQEQVAAAQAAWCRALVSIGAEHAAGRNARALAEQVLSTAYGYDQGVVLFKPTLAHGAQTFRLDKQGALAYFVGGDPTYPDDTGFALKGWRSCTPDIKGVVAEGNMAVAMGNVHLVGKDGANVTVDKTFGYRRNPDGTLAIILHHSSLPYVPAP